MAFPFGTGGSGSPTLAHPIPTQISVMGVQIFEQAYAVAPGGKIVTTPAAQLVIG